MKSKDGLASSHGSAYYRALNFFSSLYEDESGQGTLEYILILSVTVLGTSALAKAILSTLDNGIVTFGGALEKDLHTGKAPDGDWTN